MGKRLRKQNLLDAIQFERAKLDDLLAQLAPSQMTRPGVTKGGWSVKDVLAHLLEWQQMNLNWYAAGVCGEMLTLPAPGYTWREIPQLNEAIYQKHRARTLTDILHEYHANHERMVTLIQTLSDADLVALGRYAWTGPSWTLSDYIRSNTAAHYLWAYTRIRRWWRAQQKQQQ